MSIVIVAYHSREHLERCLPSLRAQTLSPLEILVVDNSPSDGTADWLRAAHPDVRLVTPHANAGYAGGNNLGVQQAQGDLVLVLNPDTELDPDVLERLVRASEARPRALITAKLLHPGGTIDACGLRMHYTGITSCRAQGDAAETHPGLHEVPLISGAAFLVARDDFIELGGFDEDYFMYFEDVDLSLRARLHGLEVLCHGDALVTHHHRLAMTPGKFYHLERNRLLTLLKIYQARTLRRTLPALLYTELLTWGFAVLKGWPYLRARWRGYGYLWSHRRAWQEKRRAFARQRLRADRIVLRDSVAQLPFDQLMTRGRARRVMDSLTRPFFEVCFRWVNAG